MIRSALSKGLHRFQGDFIPVSIEQMRLLFSAKLDDPVLPRLVDRETKRLKCELRRTSTRPVRYGAQKRMFFHQIQTQPVGRITPFNTMDRLRSQ